MNNYEFEVDGNKYFIDANNETEAELIFEDLISIESKLENIKLDKINLVKSNARNLLNETDWKELRHYRQKYLETATSLTEEEFEELLEEREAIRVNSNTLESVISACTTIEELNAIEF